MKKLIALMMLASCLLAVGCENGNEVPMDASLLQDISAELSGLLTSGPDGSPTEPSSSVTQESGLSGSEIIQPPVSDIFVSGINPFLYANAEDSMHKEQGELKLYGNYYNPSTADGRYFIYERYGKLRYTTIEAYAQDDTESGRELCFRKGCDHSSEANCPAILPPSSDNNADRWEYERCAVLDYHDSAKAPVLYLFREALNEEDITCTYIEAYDLSGGFRNEIYSCPSDEIGEIERIYSYGDLLLLQTADCRLYRLDKSGKSLIELEGLPFSSEEPEFGELQVLGVENDRLYVTFEWYKLYSLSLDMSDVRQELDLSPDPWNGLVTEEVYISENQPFYYIHNGYLYYMDDLERVVVLPYGAPEEIKCNLYRLPISDLTTTPERILTGIAHNDAYHQYAEDYFYYEILDLKRASNANRKDVSNGEMRILNLNTMQDNRILKETNMTLIIYSGNGSCINFGGYGVAGTGALGNYSLGRDLNYWLEPDGTCVRPKEYLYTGYMEEPTYRDVTIYNFELD